MIGPRILVIDDEPQIQKLLRIALEAHEFSVTTVGRGGDGIARAAVERPDLVILDLGLPDMDGKGVIARIREWSTVPILILSVREGEAEKVAALDGGANDYVVKPFSVPELLARVRALLRVTVSDVMLEQAELSVGDLTIDIARHEVRQRGVAVKVTRKEFDLLRLLARHVGRIVTHQQLLRGVWGKAHEKDTQYLRVFIGQLRHKLGDDPAKPTYILNEPGVGYRLLEPPVS